MFIRLLQHFTLPFISALGNSFVSFFERMNLTDDKNEFYFFFFWKTQQNAAENLEKNM